LRIVTGSRTGTLGTWAARLQHGFTLVELLVVMLIIGLLLSIAVPRYFHTVAKARETVLRQDLLILREAIDKHVADLNQYPDTLAALVDKKYVKAVPVDPFTRSSDTWTLVLSEDPERPGIRDLHSGAPDRGADDTEVASW
jgi:general secretion pathway protein G